MTRDLWILCQTAGLACAQQELLCQLGVTLSIQWCIRSLQSQGKSPAALGHLQLRMRKAIELGERLCLFSRGSFGELGPSCCLSGAAEEIKAIPPLDLHWTVGAPAQHGIIKAYAA